LFDLYFLFGSILIGFRVPYGIYFLFGRILIRQVWGCTSSNNPSGENSHSVKF